MSATAALRPFSFAGFPVSAWAFALRIWIAVIVALCASFWLELEAPSSAASTVAILALSTRGQALEKAVYRLMATVIGIVASIAIVGLFSQARDLLLLALAAWLGLCVFAAGLFDGNRAYAAVLSGYTVAFIAVHQIDNPQHVFESGMSRGAGIVIGIAAMAIVNDLLAAPDTHPWLAAQLTALHGRIGNYAKAVLRNAASDPLVAAGLLRDIAGLRSEMTSLSTDSSAAWGRSAAARSTAVALVAELHAARVMDALPVATNPALRAWLTSELNRSGSGHSPASLVPPPGGTDSATADPMALSLGWALGELLRRKADVSQGLAALKSGARLPKAWRTPFCRSYRSAAEAGLRSVIWFALASIFFVFAGWSAADASLSLVAVVIGLGAVTPNPRGFTTIALMVAPMAAGLAGVLEFLVLDGATEFPLLAIALAPPVIGLTLLMTLPNPTLASLGRLGLIFTLVTLDPSNPQTYNPEQFLFTSLFLCLAIALLLAAQLLIAPVSDERRRRWLIASAWHELGCMPSRKDRRYSPEEAMFRDAVRIGQIVGPGAPNPAQRAALEEVLSIFDQAALFRQCHSSLSSLADGPAAGPASNARPSLIKRDPELIRAAAFDLHNAGTEDAIATRTSAALLLASLVLDAASPQPAVGTVEGRA